MCPSFVDALMSHIMEGTMVPKVQVERVVGPVIGMFLADVLTETFRDDPALSGSIRMICAEFPLKKRENKQSTNIDWLMLNPERGQLVLVELKTSDTSVRVGQSSTYRAIQQTIRDQGGAFLIDDFRELRSASTEHGKYDHTLEKRLEPLEAAIAAAHEATIVYLVPRSVEHKVRSHADRLLFFSSLSDSIRGPHASEWKTIHSYLCRLDESSKYARNRKSGAASERLRPRGERQREWQGTVKFPAMFDLCAEKGNDIVIGFTGGKEAFSARTLAQLQSRPPYKWDFAENTGRKKRSDWLPGGVILEILKTRHGYSGDPI